MSPELRQRIQISLVILLLLATARVAYIFHERKSAATAPQRDDGSRALTSDEYVFPKKFYAYDLVSAKALVGKPVWIKQGYGNLVYPVVNGSADLSRGKASLLPIEQLKIADVFRQAPPASWKAPHGETELLMISRGDPKENRAKVQEHGLTFQVLLQQRWEISRLYAMFATPVAYLIDEAGIITHDVAVGMDSILALMADAASDPAKELAATPS